MRRGSCPGRSSCGGRRRRRRNDCDTAGSFRRVPGLSALSGREPTADPYTPNKSPPMTRLSLTAFACLVVAVKSAPAQQPASGRSFHDRYAELTANRRHLSDSARLRELFRVNWAYVMTEYPEFATYVGYPGQNARW